MSSAVSTAPPVGACSARRREPGKGVQNRSLARSVVADGRKRPPSRKPSRSIVSVVLKRTFVLFGVESAAIAEDSVGGDQGEEEASASEGAATGLPATGEGQRSTACASNQRSNDATPRRWAASSPYRPASWCTASAIP